MNVITRHHERLATQFATVGMPRDEIDKMLFTLVDACYYIPHSLDHVTRHLLVIYIKQSAGIKDLIPLYHMGLIYKLDRMDGSSFDDVMNQITKFVEVHDNTIMGRHIKLSRAFNNLTAEIFHTLFPFMKSKG